MLQPIYTVFTLADPSEPLVIRYVGMTSQTLYKRYSALMGTAKRNYGNGYNSFLSQWIRELIEQGKQPEAKIVIDTTDKDDAHAHFVNTFNEYVGSGKMLNCSNGIHWKPMTEPMSMDGKRVGRRVSVSDSARASIRRKTRNDKPV